MYITLDKIHNQSSHTRVSWLLWMGVAASIIVGLGEYLLHYLPEGPGGEVAMLERVPLGRASIGHFLVVFGAPLYFAGYHGLKRFFQPTSPLLARVLLVAGVLSFSIGGVWVSSRYFGAEVLQRSLGTPDHAFYLQSYEDHYQILVWALRVLVAIVSVVYVWLVLIDRRGLPRWMALFNPVLLLALIISTLFWLKPLGVHVAPIAMNVTHFIFFSIVLFINQTNNLRSQ